MEAGVVARRLPPLNALRAFEAAARLLSFSKAADELHITHGAVSRAIRQLESDLGIHLFQRTTRSVKLTPTGASYAREVRDVLDHLAAATVAATGPQSSGLLNLSTVDSLAAKWLVPRLFRFRRAHPEIDVRLSTSERLVDFVNDGMDIAIRYGQGRYPGLQSELLVEEDLSPVCSPSLLEGPHPLRTPADLKYHTLIHDDFHIDWAMWLRTAGITDIDPHRGPRFYSSEHAVQAAVLGEGVILGRSALVADDLASGRLIRPFTIRLPAGLAYYVVYPARSLRRPSVKIFRDWLLAEAAAENEQKLSDADGPQRAAADH
jgi:LysR family transcriptional regulator, glycine cleavage system transcriptional activator